MKVVLLGRLAEIAGWRERDMPPAATLDALRARLTDGDEALAAALSAPGVRVAVDRSLAPRTTLEGAEEVAFLPIVSGG